MLRKRVLFPLLCSLLIFSVTTWAQTSGSIRGEVTDSEGKPLPGAAVTIASDALIGGTRTTYSNELGVFRFPSLPIGAYSVEITMEGFETIQVQKVGVGLEATSNVPVSMKLSSVAEQLTVIGETPVIDVTQSGLSSSFKEEMIENVPTQRNMYDLMQVAPGMSVDLGDGMSDRIVAFGSNRQSNSWNVDGVEVSGPETGSAWWTVNTDLIQEIQVLGVGAPAEYGNHTGAVLNVVTKKGGNNYHGAASYFFQSDGLTDTNVDLTNGTNDCCFHRDLYRNFASQLGGPILKGKVWFFGAYEYYREGSTQPGNDPAFTPVGTSDKYDFKGTAQLWQNHEVAGFVHYEKFAGPDAAVPNYAPSALSGESGTNPAWGASLTSTLSTNTLLEVSYAGWWSDDIHDSQTGSFDEPFIDYTPEGGGPTQFSGGVQYPWDYVTWREQLNAKATHYADNFLNSQHEFKFGVQFSKGSAKTNLGIGPNGSYTYSYYGTLYQARQDPYQYGGVSTDLGFFLDDTITVNDRLTLNLGVRFDHNTGGIPDYERLTIGTPSISPSGNFTGTGETIPGVKDLVSWNLISPRVGFVLQTREDGRSVLQGSFGVYYDHNVIGNWDYPPPGYPTFRLFQFNPDTGQFDTLISETNASDIGFDPELKAPRTYQYSAGYEHQVSDAIALGVQYVYKDTQDLVGWEILGGQYEPFAFVDPFTGATYTLLNEVVTPTFRKGNDPGDFPGSEGLDYFQKYHGLVFTFDKRFSDRWALSASYTWSKSEGLIPRMLAQAQFNPFYGSTEGRDPNTLSINSSGRLQGDRPHMFRVQTVVQKLPWDLQASASMEFSSGRPYSRQVRVFDLNQSPAPRIIMERGLRFSPIENIDLSVGKRINIGGDFRLRVEAWVFNLLNSDQELNFAELALNSTDETFVPDLWIQPRRLQLRVGFEF